MKIGLFTPSYPGTNGEGGIGTYTRALAHGLSARGHGVHVLTPGAFPVGSHDGPVALHATCNDYLRGVDRFLPGAGACYHVARSMRRLALRHALDVVEFPNWEGHGLWFSATARTPVVVRLSTSSLESAFIDGSPLDATARWEIRREHWLARSAGVLVTHSEAHRLRMADEVGIDVGRIGVVPLGVATDPSFVRPPRLGEALQIVYLGRLERRKGTVDLLRAVPAVVREVPEARFALIGADRPHCPGGRTHARFAAEELPAEARERIEFAGPLAEAEVRRRLQSADLFVSPSLYESFGLTFLEAMRWGTPVIGTTVGGIPEIVEDGRSGRLVAPGRPDELARAIISLLRDEGSRRRLGESGRARAESTFSVERMAAGSEDLYSRLIRGNR
jgi:glycogen(starch) synthase